MCWFSICYKTFSTKTVCCYETFSTKDSLLLAMKHSLQRQSAAMKHSLPKTVCCYEIFSIKDSLLLWNILYQRQSAKRKREQCQTWNTRESRDVSWRALCHDNPCELSANLGKPVTQASLEASESKHQPWKDQMQRHFLPSPFYDMLE